MGFHQIKPYFVGIHELKVNQDLPAGASWSNSQVNSYDNLNGAHWIKPYFVGLNGVNQLNSYDNLNGVKSNKTLRCWAPRA